MEFHNYNSQLTCNSNNGEFYKNYIIDMIRCINNINSLKFIYELTLKYYSRNC